MADRLLNRLPETAPLSRSLGIRSPGVRDLRDGRVTEGVWWVAVPFLDQARHYYVAGSLTRGPAHSAGHLLGDGLVRHSSASGQGRTRRVPLGSGAGVRLRGLGHLSLLNHAEVYRHLETWLGRTLKAGTRRTRLVREPQRRDTHSRGRNTTTP